MVAPSSHYSKAARNTFRMNFALHLIYSILIFIRVIQAITSELTLS